MARGSIFGCVFVATALLPRAALSQGGTGPPLAPTPSWHAEGSNHQASLGYSMTACDVNGDGFSDVFPATPLHDGAFPGSGIVMGFHGSPAGLPAEPSWSTVGPEPWAGRGQMVSCAGDVDGDGFEDLLVTDANFMTKRGMVLLFRGSAGGLSRSPAWQRSGTGAGDNYGWTLAGTDVDADGHSDALVAANYASGGQEEEGLVFVYRGSPTGLEAPAGWRLELDRPRAGVGAAIAPVGDVDGDGFGDLLVGYRGERGDGLVLLSGGPEGRLSGPVWEWVLPAGGGYEREGIATGDVDGDGLVDVLVASDRADGTAEDAGAVWVFHGSAGGFASTPDATLEGSSESQWFGSGLTVADVDRDGFDDVAIGSAGFGGELPGQGRVQLYLGGVEGLSAEPAWEIAGDQADAHLGGNLAFADVDGDGIPDLLAAASSYSLGEGQEGRVYLYLGRDGP